MDYYIDIQLKPDAEMRENVLLNKVYTKFHKALFSLKATDIGVSFPNYKIKLGNLIRVHGSETRLKELQSANWLGGLSGYCEVTEVQSIPAGLRYRNVSR
ncbi:MAG: type I-F CRISPR-associated endoribonuclease Cas6/Csy4, partial [Candidatus Anammoxibacter sp.]